jgi:outer membrane biosynthesis protein TonB
VIRTRSERAEHVVVPLEELLLEAPLFEELVLTEPLLLLEELLLVALLLEELVRAEPLLLLEELALTEPLLLLEELACPLDEVLELLVLEPLRMLALLLETLVALDELVPPAVDDVGWLWLAVTPAPPAAVAAVAAPPEPAVPPLPPQPTTTVVIRPNVKTETKLVRMSYSPPDGSPEARGRRTSHRSRPRRPRAAHSLDIGRRRPKRGLNNRYLADSQLLPHLPGE